MMPYIKSNNNLDNLISKYFLSLFLLIIYGLYKTFTTLYHFNKLSLKYVISPFLLLIISIGIGYLTEIIYQKFITKEKSKQKIKISILNCLIISMLMPFKINLFIYTISLFISLLIIKLLKLDKKVNSVALILVLLIIILQIFKLNDYALVNNNLKLSMFDLFIGRGVGGVFSTSCFYIIIAYFILKTDMIYKKEIPFYILMFYLILIIIYTLATYNYDCWSFLLNGFIPFCAVFIAPFSLNSCYSKKGKLIYSMLIAIICFILTNFLNIYFGIYLAIFITSLLTKLIDKILVENELKK